MKVIHEYDEVKDVGLTLPDGGLPRLRFSVGGGKIVELPIAHDTLARLVEKIARASQVAERIKASIAEPPKPAPAVAATPKRAPPVFEQPVGPREPATFLQKVPRRSRTSGRSAIKVVMDALSTGSKTASELRQAMHEAGYSASSASPTVSRMVRDGEVLCHVIDGQSLYGLPPRREENAA